MKRLLLLAILFATITACKKTPVTPPVVPPVEPPITPVTFTGLVTTSTNFPTADGSFTITFDPSKGNTALYGYTGDVYVHIGAITNLSSSATDWKYVKFGWSVNNTAAKMTRQSTGKYTIDVNPRAFLGVPSAETILKLAMVFRNGDGTLQGKNKDGTDIYLPLYSSGTMSVRFAEPELEPTFTTKPVVSVTTVGEELTVTAVSSSTTNLALTLNDVSFATASNATKVSGKAKITAAGLQTIKVSGGGAESSFTFMIGGTPVIAALPSGANANGITFINGGTSAIFALTAPGKQYMNVIGDFNNWTPDNNSFMKKTPDGNTWWVQIDGLDASKEYTYQFLSEGTLKVADPYCEKILDPWNDSSIPAANYSGFGTYPTGKTTGIVSTMKYNQTAYNWQYSSGFTRPAKNNLVIYELHLRDFLVNNNYQTLTDTLNYLSNLGVNAVELMPVNEFEGNSSWGYNPDFYFAPDKFYGSKYHLQRFIDMCHAKGIAVVLDMVLNHSTGLSPMAQLYWDATANAPSVNSPWYNTSSPHPLNFGPDFNHEKAATKSFVKDILKFWMQQYKIDGFRFDLSKGFTQTNSGTDMNHWAQYDQGRIDIWKDYNNYVKSIDANNFYVILEHFADASEEKVLANEGMMLWNNLNYNFNEATMGWLTNSDFKWAMYSQHGFISPEGLVTYMESHDEERLMFKNITYGNASGSYNVKDLATALKRQEMAAAFLFAIPGPKMIWQFGELGYDVSIDQNGRVGEKPLHWEYNTQPNRIALKNAFAKFINYKKKNAVFTSTNITYNFSGAVKYIKLQDASNTVVVVGNFDVTSQAANVDFGTAGTWYDAANTNLPMTLAGNSYTATLDPGEYHIYTRNLLAQ